MTAATATVIFLIQSLLDLAVEDGADVDVLVAVLIEVRETCDRCSDCLLPSPYITIHDFDFGTFRNGGVDRANVYREPLSVFTGKDSPLCKFPELSIEQLRDETFLEIDDDYQQHYEFAIRKLCMLHGFIPKGKVRVANLEAAVLAVQRGKGIYILPRSAKTWNLPSVSAIDIADKGCYLYGCAAYRKTNDNPALPLVIKEYDRLMNESLQEEQS